MINVYSWPTPNGHKVHIMLEECGLRLGRDWQVFPVNIGAGDQFKPEFVAISPNNKIAALVGPDDGQATHSKQVHGLQPVHRGRHRHLSVAAQLVRPGH